MHRWSFLTLACLTVVAAKGATPVSPGAQVPFVTIEAESSTNQTTGTVVLMKSKPKATDSSPELEASGRGYVELAKPNDALDVRAGTAANTLVLRHCIPDAPSGGGITATLSLFVNGSFRQSLTLSSRHNWLYGTPGENGMSNNPAEGQPHVFWEEERFIISGPALRQGEVLRLQKGAKDSAAFYRIDLMDLEMVTAAPPPAPDAILSVTDFGADGQDGKDDTEAIAKCIEAAKSQNRTVWLPRGTYHQSRKLTLDGVALRGAGMWLTSLIGTEEGKGWGGNVGFDLAGDGPKVSDLYIASSAHVHRSTGGKPITGNKATNWLVENVWITHTLTGIWMGSSKGVVRDCRIRFTYADGINLNSGASGNLVEHNHVRGTGDDSLAILSETEKNWPVSTGNTFRFNTASATWWGHNCDLAGGSKHVIEDNLLADNSKFGCFTINLPGAYPMHPLSDSIVRRNTILRGGGNFANQARGAVWIFPGSTTISNVTLVENTILDPVFRGIHCSGYHTQELIYERNIIQSPGEDGIFIESGVKGSGTFRDNTVRKLPGDRSAFVNKAGGDYQATLSGNSFR